MVHNMQRYLSFSQIQFLTPEMNSLTSKTVYNMNHTRVLHEKCPSHNFIISGELAIFDDPQNNLNDLEKFNLKIFGQKDFYKDYISCKIKLGNNRKGINWDICNSNSIFEALPISGAKQPFRTARFGPYAANSNKVTGTIL